MLKGKRFTPAMIVAMIALAVAMSGTAVAGTAKLITGSQIANGAIKLAHLNPGAKAALKGERGATGAQGPVGAQGAQGLVGPQGLTGAKGDKGARPGLPGRRATRVTRVAPGLAARLRHSVQNAGDTNAGAVATVAATTTAAADYVAISGGVQASASTQGERATTPRCRLVPRPHGLGHQHPEADRLDGWIVRWRQHRSASDKPGLGALCSGRAR